MTRSEAFVRNWLIWISGPIAALFCALVAPVWTGETTLLPVFFYALQFLFVLYLGLVTAGMIETHTPYPRYLGLIGLSSLMVVSSSACMYLVFHIDDTVHNNKSGWEALYFSVVSFSTLGFGDLTPSPGWSRFVASTEAVLGNLHLALFAATAFKILPSK